MSKEKRFSYNEYSSPFDSPRASPKHSNHQIGGETQMSQHDIKTKVHRKAQRA